MQFYDPVAEFIAEVATYFKEPAWLWGIPIALILIFILVRWKFVQFGLDETGWKKLKRVRWWVILLRFLAVSMILVALATPFTTITAEDDGDPKALVLVDKSGSMELYDTSFVEFLTEALNEELPTTVREFGTETESPVGDAMLGHPEHILIISDGNANTGVDLLDVAQVVRAENLSINKIDLTAVKTDYAVKMSVPQKVPVGFPVEILIEVSGTVDGSVPLKVTIDGKTIHDALTTGTLLLEPSLTTGYHKIEARISSNDVNPDNNVHYKVVEVLPKPKVFVLTSKRGALETAISGLFDMTTGSTLPNDLTPYYAVIINDMKAEKLTQTEKLADFLRDEEGGKIGNGMVVFGGFNSYDRGGYQNKQFESLLPVKVGKPKREMGENNLVFVIQVSGSTTATRYVKEGGQMVAVTEDVPTIDIIKAQAVSAINSLNLKNNVGVIVFGVSTEGQSFSSPGEALQASVVKVADVQPLYKHKQELTDKIPRLTGGGTTAPDIALRAAVDMLKDKSGDKTIILLTNGRFSAGLGAGADVPAKANTLAVVENAYRRYGVNTQTLGVGSTDPSIFAKKVDESFLKNVAIAGDSTYDRATNMASLMVKYGDPNEKGFGDEFMLVPLSLTHFITRDVELDAVLNGYNEVTIKDGSKLLVTTDSGLPAITTWNYFNGRVAAVTVFTASGLGQLLQRENSDLIRNTVLWAVGDPSRKEKVSVTVKPAIAGEETQVEFISKEPVSGNCQDTPVEFLSSAGDSYTFTFTPQKQGFGTVCGIPYAVNENSEFWSVGQNQDLMTAVQITEGKSLDFDKVDEIVEQIKTVSSRITVQKTEVRTPFLAIGLILFLLEIFIRRLTKIQ